MTALRLEALTHDSLPFKGASRGTNGNFILTGFEAQAESADPAKEPPVSEIEWSPWSALGPFNAGSTKEVFEKAFINETEIDFNKTYDDTKLRWKEKADWKDGTAQALSGENQVTYFLRDRREGALHGLTFGSDGGLQLWLNGESTKRKNFSPGCAAPDEAVLLGRRK